MLTKRRATATQSMTRRFSMHSVTPFTTLIQAMANSVFKDARKKRWTLEHILTFLRSRVSSQYHIFVFLEIRQSNMPIISPASICKRLPSFDLYLRLYLRSFLWVNSSAIRQLCGSYSGGCGSNTREHCVSLSPASALCNPSMATALTLTLISAILVHELQGTWVPKAWFHRLYLWLFKTHKHQQKNSVISCCCSDIF